jgi:Uma2 family endonuclease
MSALLESPRLTRREAGPPRPWRVSRDRYYQLAEQGHFEGQRVERIRGEIIEMSPIGFKHWLTVEKVSDALEQVFGSGFIVTSQGQMPAGDSDPQPDVSVIRGQLKDFSDHPRDRELVVEVSDSSLEYDMGRKADLYASAGVKDYWVIDLVNLRVLVHRGAAVDAANEFGWRYIAVEAFSKGQTIVPLSSPAGAGVTVDDLLP